MADVHNLQRFVDAQKAVLPDVIAELTAGRKRSHWMWFVFPQIAGLGHSAMAQRFAIASIAEARAYLAHPDLGPRLHRCTELANGATGRSAYEVFGSPDDLKFRSSMTLFSFAAPDDRCFAAALDRYFGGAPDRTTLALLQEARHD